MPLFVVNGKKLLPQRDLAVIELKNDEDIRRFFDILGKWYFVRGLDLDSGYFVKNMLSNRFEWLHLVVGSGLGEGVYKIREGWLDHSQGLRLHLGDFDYIKEVGDPHDFATWAENRGLATKKEIVHYMSRQGNPGSLPSMLMD